MDYNVLFNFERPLKEVLHDVLLARGFLMEYDEDCNLRLSDNSMLLKPRSFQMMWDTEISDQKYLQMLLERSKFGRYGSGRRILLDQDQKITKSQVDVFLRFIRISGETGYDSIMNRPNRFFNTSESKLRSFKIPVVVLEPFIALLVKAYSAIGISTCFSCDGHGSADASVSFLSYPYSRWAELVTQIALKNTKPNSKWDFTDWHLTIKGKNHDTLYYKGILDVARFLYENRIEFLEMKRRVITDAVKKRLNDRDYVLGLLKEGVKLYGLKDIAKCTREMEES